MSASALGADLLADLLQEHGEARMRAQGTSMLPSIRPGDVLIIEAADVSEIPLGAIAVWRRGERLVAHRVIEQMVSADGSLKLVTCGDRQQQRDESIGDEELLGRVTMIQRGPRTMLPGPQPSAGARLLRCISRFTDWPAGLLVLCTRRH